MNFRQIKLFFIGKFQVQEIDEKDERNIMIRGKAALNTFLVTLFLISAMVFIFLFFNYSIPSLIAIIALFIQISSFFIFLRYYSNKL